MAKNNKTRNNTKPSRREKFFNLYKELIYTLHEKGDIVSGEIDSNDISAAAKKVNVSAVRIDDAMLVKTMTSTDWVEYILNKRRTDERNAMRRYREKKAIEENQASLKAMLENTELHIDMEEPEPKQRLDYPTDTFMVNRQRLNDLFGEEYVTEHPELIAAAVVADELTGLRLEMTQLQIALREITTAITELKKDEIH